MSRKRSRRNFTKTKRPLGLKRLFSNKRKSTIKMNKNTDDNYVLNPASGRYVLKSGAIGKKIMALVKETKDSKVEEMVKKEVKEEEKKEVKKEEKEYKRDFEERPRKPIGYKTNDIDVLLAKKFEMTAKGEFPNVTGWYISEKLDGIRAYWSHKEGELFTRNGLKINAPDWFINELPQDIDLDGELWIDRVSFNKISGIARRHYPDDKEWKQVKYLVFDAPEINLPFEERYALYTKILSENNSPFVIPVKSWPAKNNEDVLEQLASIEKLGAEGLMLRKPGSMYERKRSGTLLKLKTFDDDEATVIGYEKGLGKYDRAVERKSNESDLNNFVIGSLLVKDKNGAQFNVGTGLNDEQRINPPKIGSTITYKFFEKSKDGIPRFPIFIGLRTDI